jgi:GTP-binding protein Era
MKAGFVALIGRPSSGKSTLLNHLCGYKVSIVAPSPQTTRNKIRGIVTRDEGQLVFIDTPGFHHSQRKFNLHMRDLVSSSLEEIDIVLYIIDVTRPLGQEEEILISMLQPFSDRMVIALNKIDAGTTYREQIAATVEHTLTGPAVIPISALQGDGIHELLQALFAVAPDGEPFYPEEFYTDQEPVFRATEIIREKALLRVREELPHALYVDIADMEADEEKEDLWIRAFLIVERESQKGILVGKGGKMIKAMRVDAQRELEEIFPYRVRLDLRVKVQPKWRKNENTLQKLIF